MITEPASLVNGMVDQPGSHKLSSFLTEVYEWAEDLAQQTPGISANSISPTHLRFFKGEHVLFDLLLNEISGAKGVLNASEKFIRDTTFRKVILWEDLWYTKRRIVTYRLRALLGLSERIPARLTRVERLDRPTTTAFLQENHLQDPVLSKLKYGLYLPERYYRVIEDKSFLPEPRQASELLVAVATFAHPRTFQKEHGPHRSFEFVRFANLAPTTVVGGLDKLLKHFIRENQPDDIMTYADLEWSDGHSYHKLGFTQMQDTVVQEFWVDTHSMARYATNRLPEGINEMNAQDLGYVKIVNAGSRKFVKTLTY